MSNYSTERGYKLTWPEDLPNTNIYLGLCLQGLVCLTLGFYDFFFYLTILATFLHPENTDKILETKDYFRYFPLLSDNPWLAQILCKPFAN